ncbi:MAG TPA: hypothetical protein VMZ06_08510 [Candidatus Bathyarchaeia archaeon]|nr:hypothetical protein [Candidatus Bathyarchaeia archaeon]
MRPLVLLLVLVSFCCGAETLYNGIVLPDVWPPRDRAPSREPMPVPYLESPPAVMPIDVGRQLFVDDFLVAQTTMQRKYHKAEYYAGNPVLQPDKPWETQAESQNQPAPTAMVFSDGVWYDKQDGLFKMWYMAGYCHGTAYATSRDGIHWDKPELDVVPGTNFVHTTQRDSATVWLDADEKDPARRYKMFVYVRPYEKKHLAVYFSPDGIHWSDAAAHSGPLGDRSTVFYNPFRKVWVYSIRDYAHPGIGRYRRYWEHADVIEAAKWEEGQAPFWVGADTLDAPRPDVNNTPCELYNLDAAGYESLMIGLFSIWRGQPQDRAKPNDLCIGFSRDGFHWQRPTHEPFVPVSENVGDWNWANIQSAGGCCVIVGDRLYFYVSGRKGVPGSPASGVCSTGLATLRRDGFASMEAGADGGVLTTRPVLFKGRELFVNASVTGELRAAVIDESGAVIPGFSEQDCTPWKGDSTRQRLSWNSSDLGQLAGKPVRFRFSMRAGQLYSFWVSPDESGASGGYYAGGLVEKL